MSPFRVYLGGKITTEDEYFTKWREEAEAELVRWGVLPMNPLFKQELALSKDRGITPAYPAEDVLMRDYRMVKSSDLVLVNLKTIGYSGKPISDPIIGTLYEAGWAWEDKKPLIAIAEPDSIYARHPFVKATSTRIFSDHMEAVKSVIDFWAWKR